MAIRFHYFDINGIGEFVRYMLYYGKVDFEDVRYDLKSWPNKAIKDALPYGQFPLYEEGNRKLVQSIAIARFVGKKVGLLPEDPWDQAELDAIVQTIFDFRTYFMKAFYETDNEKKKTYLKEFLEVHLPYYFSRFEKTLKDNNGYFKRQLSWADFVFVGVIESGNLFHNLELEKNYPTIKALTIKLRGLPGVKEYIARRKPYSL